MTDDKKPFAFDFGNDEPTIEAAVFQALGAASTCWDEKFIGPAGLGGIGITERIFDSTRAKEIGDALLSFIGAVNLSQAGDIPLSDAIAITHKAVDEFGLKPFGQYGLGEKVAD